MSVTVKNPPLNAGSAKAVTYARVSSKEQEKEGFSIPAQLKLLNDYAAGNALSVVREFVDVETAKQSGRTNFSELIAYLRKHPNVRVVLVEKTDRLYRNLKDWVTVDELDIEIHLVKEGLVLSRDSRSSEKFVHGIKVLMAKNYIDNLSEEARKGQMEKAEQGIWPTKAPLGYTNVMGPDGKKIITPDPATSQIISDLFEWYATGQHSIKDVAEKARGAGLIYRRTGAAVPTSTIHNILRNRIYYGEYEWNGQIFRGRHEPLVTYEVWERAQKVLYGRKDQKLRRSKWDFAFSGIVTCGHCGCAMVGEIKKGKYVYYHCTGFKGKCNEPYVREEVFVEQFGRLLRGLSFDRSVLEVVCAALRDSYRDEKRDHEAAIAALQIEQERLQKRIHAIYIDKLDGTVDQRFFERMSRDWRNEQELCAQQIQRHQSADQSYLEEGARLLELAHQAETLFTDRGAPDKRRLLNFLLSNSSWKEGSLTAKFREPFDLIAETAIFAAANPVQNAADLAAHPGWLGD